MTIYDSKNYRKIWENYNGPIPRDENGRKYQIHHIDGNRDNNDISNLKCVSIREHYDIHFNQGDFGACMLIQRDIDRPPHDIKELARKMNLSRVENGTHPWLGGEMQKRTQRKRVEDGIHHFLGGEIQKNAQIKIVEKGTHHLLGSSMNEYMLKNGKHASQKKKECPHCGKIVDLLNYGKYHGDNCFTVTGKKFIAPFLGCTKKKEYYCEHCGKWLDKSNYNRWHGDNCKYKK